MLIAKRIINIFNTISLFRTFSANNIRRVKDKAFIIIGKKAYYNFSKSSVITILNASYFFFGRLFIKNDNFVSILSLSDDANLVVKGKFSIYTGARVSINKGATLVLGSGYINHNLSLSCYEYIYIGFDVVISENFTIRDSDNHILIGTENITAPIIIEDHVWIGMNVTILKGVTVGDGAVIAAGSVVNRNVPANTLVGGIPAKVLKENVEWKR
jgi:acetyltransferase-like isoleucine patch superfamily enzyme